MRHRDNPALFLPDGMWADNCTDNAFMESCWGTLKTEMAIVEYDGEAHARRSVREYVGFYRFDRKHSSLGYLTPTQFTRLGRPRR